MTHSPLEDDLMFLQSLRARGIDIRADGDDIVCRANIKTLTEEDAARLRQGKSRLIGLLRTMGRDNELPLMTPDPEGRFEPFPLTENQEAYWLGRGENLDSGGVGIHLFVELLFDDFDPQRFSHAWTAMIRRHPMLRAVILPDGRQRMLNDDTPIQIEEEQLPEGGEEREAVLAAARREISHMRYVLLEWPQFRLKALHPPRQGNNAPSRTVLMVSVDLWCFDMRSMQVAFEDLADLYLGVPPRPAPRANFRDYVLSMQKLMDRPVYENSLAYWRDRLPHLPPAPALPLSHAPEAAAAHFLRRSKRFPESLWNRVRERAAVRGLTPSSVLIASYASVISRWSSTKHFTLNIPRYNRLPLHPDINEIVGEFASFSLLEVDNRDSPSFESLAARIQTRNWADLAHSHVSGVRVLREWKQYLGKAPAVMAPFVFTNEPEHDLPIDEAGQKRKTRSWIGSLERMAVVRTLLTQTPQVWVDSQFTEIDGELYVSWDSIDALFPEGMIGRMFEAYSELIESLGEDDAWTASEIPLPLSETALRHVLTGPGETLPSKDPWEAMRERAKTQSATVAATDAQGSLTWAQACEAVTLLADRLKALGVGKGTPVAFALPKGRNQLVGSMAIHAAEAVLVPLDHESPQARAEAILADSGAALLLTECSCADRFSRHPTPILVMDDDEAPLPVPPAGPPSTIPDAPYCLIYTSGSTGKPKGVKVPLPGLLNMLQDAERRFQLGSRQALLSLNPVYHDLALFDITGSALFGWRLAFPDPARIKDPGHWLEVMEQNGADIWMTVPATMVMLLDYIEGSGCDADAMSNIKVAFLGGDWIPLDTPRRLWRVSPSTTVVSIGGPTEVTVWNLLFPMQHMDPAWKSIPYGYPIRNAAYHILDERLEDCPVMVTGELYCSGAGVTTGYLNDPEKTDAAYIVHPAKGLRMFRTGDLGRLHPEGYIEFIGRRDNQVNINGYRIEPGEIESALGLHPAVSQSVVVVGAWAGKADALAAWVTLKPGHEASLEELRRHLSARLPKYMTPSFVAIADGFPLTQNNKIDRKAIAGWEPKHASEEQLEPPSTPTELMLEQAWRDLLGCRPVSREQNFFESGGNSITAVRLYTSVISGKYAGLSVASVFTHPTLRGLAEAIDRAATQGGEEKGKKRRAAWPTVRPLSPRPSEIPATRMQRRMFYEHQRLGTNCYNMSLQISIPENADPASLEKAFAAVVRRQETLRTVFCEATEEQTGERQVFQHILDYVEVPVEVARVRIPLAEEAFMEEAAAFGREITMRPFDLERGPLVRIGMLIGEKGRAECFIAYHHLALDGWSLTPLLEELSAALEGRELPAPRLHPADVAAWEQSPGFAEAVADRLPAAADRFSASGTPTVLPSARSVNTGGDEGTSSADSIDPSLDVYIPSDAVAAIARQAESKGLTSFSVMCTLFGVLLAEHAGTDNAQFGTFTAARTLPGLEEPMGAMTCPSPLFLECNWASPLAEVSRHMLGLLSSSMEEALLPFEDLVREVCPHRANGDLPFFGVAFTHDNTPATAIHAGGMVLLPAGTRQYRTSVDLEVAVSSDVKGTRLSLVYNPDKYRRRVVQDLAERFVALVRHAAEDIECPLKELLVERHEDRLMRITASAGKTLAPARQTLLDYFHAAKAREEAEPSLREVRLGKNGPYVSAAVSMRELGRMADAVSARLLEKGLRPGDRVALHMGRSARFASAMLAVMQCGASFIPVPLSLEADRLRHILDVSGARFLLRAPDADPIPLPESVIVLQSEKTEEGSARLDRGILPPLTSDTEACLFFTSGSTGMPKGVRLTHGNWVNRLEAGWHALPYDSGEACIAKTSIGFIDIFCEFFQPLFKGVPVHVVAEGEERDVEVLLRHISHWKISRAMIVASLISSMLDAAEHAPERWPLACLSHVTSSGERLSPELAERFYRMLPHAELYNYYGSTEVTADVVCGRISGETHADSGRHVPLGRPMPNTLAAVVGSRGVPLAHGMVGQICIAGPCVSPGYTDADQDRWIDVEGRRYFATGDLGMWTEDGELLGFGRADRQVKIRGQKVETGDVEEAIRKNAQVADVCVFVTEDAFQPLLQAAVVLREAGAISMDALRRNMRVSLGGPMMPARFVEVPGIPRTPSDKPDIPALLRMNLVRNAASPAGEWKNATERTLAELWSTLIGEPVSSRDADFFSSGGHSLLAMRLVTLVRDHFGIGLKVRDVFESPTLADMAEIIELLVEARCENEPLHAVKEVI